MTKIKMCGLSTALDIDYANEVLPDYIGFVFASFSKRAVDEQKAKALSLNVDKRIKKVGVFYNHSIDFILKQIDKKIISIVQLHGDESDDFIKDLKKKTNAKVIKAFSVEDENDIKKAEKSIADYILIDNKIAGSGQRFDWSIIKSIKKPFFLAGGLNCDNVLEALKLNPFAVDVSSGIETDNKKDIIKMKDFAKKVRQSKC